MIFNRFSILIVAIASSCDVAFSLQGGGGVAKGTTTPTRRETSLNFGTISSIDEASTVLSKWDEQYDGDDPNLLNSIGNFGNDKMNELYRLLPDAVRYLNAVASDQRSRGSPASAGRCILGICASSSDEGLGALKSWVTELELPRGLLKGMDDNGVPIQMDGGVYLKYNTALLKRKGLALWNPGDVLASSYDGNYRGVYFQVELNDKTFRQYLVPSNIFL